MADRGWRHRAQPRSAVFPDLSLSKSRKPLMSVDYLLLRRLEDSENNSGGTAD
jgi:hypothetical protein